MFGFAGVKGMLGIEAREVVMPFGGLRFTNPPYKKDKLACRVQ